MPQQISVRIDNELYTATEGQTILQVAADNGRSIPTLCYLEGLSAPGSCRLCLVEVAGVGRLLPACTTPARSGMSVTTNSDALAHNPDIIFFAGLAADASTLLTDLPSIDVQTLRSHR